MTLTRNIAATAFLSALSVLGAEVTLAGDAVSVQTMKPLHGISFEVGTKHAVSYFLSDEGKCNLVLTLAEDPNWGDVPSLTVTRFEAAIPAGKATRFNSTEGKKLEFECLAGAAAMSVRPVEQVAIERNH